MKFETFPIIHISLFFILGILFGAYFAIPISMLLCSLGISTTLFLIMGFLLYKNKVSAFVFKVVMLFLFLQIGYTTHYVHLPQNKPNHYSHYLATEKSEIGFEITEPLKENPYFDQYFAKVNLLDKNVVSGKILVKIPKSDSLQKLEIGSVIIGQATLKLIPKAKNPNQFDYANYLANKGVFHELILKPKTFLIVKKETGWFQKVAHIRNQIAAEFDQTTSDPKNIAILKALLIGQKQYIDAETKTHYTDAGAVHILAISGLHVGIILFFFVSILKPLKRIRFGNLLELFILLIILWGFAFLAGLSPSVVRSVTMFSFISIGMQLNNRGKNIYNTLAISAFLLLLFNPSFLFDVGFQLSYLAVLSIVTFQPYLSKTLWKPRNKILGYFHDVITVSFAAQIGVLPLSLFYFHQFPGLFFVTNLVVIPLVTIILGFGVIALLLALIGAIPAWLIYILDFFLHTMNQYIAWVAQFQSLIFKNIPANVLIVVLGYAVLLSLGFCVKKDFKRFMMPFLATLILLQIAIIGTHYWHFKEEKWFVIHQYRNSVLVHQKAQAMFVFASSTENINTKVIENIAQAHFSSVDSIKKLRNVYVLGNKKILILDSLGIIPKNYKPDIIWITQSPKINLDRILSEIKVSEVIIDGSNKPYLAKLWQESCRSKNIPFHNTYEKGFYSFE
jgi:competence protein ComEC